MIKISDAELEVMQILWKVGKATSFDIIDNIKEDWNESTVRTLINRLQLKGAIEIIEKNGKTYTYRPIINEDEYKIVESNSFLKKMYSGSINNLLLNFVKQKKLSKQDLEDLIDLIEKEEK